MKTIWYKSRREKIIIKCPICGHQTAPPKYPHCDHTLFVFVEPSGDDAFFDFMRRDFRDVWPQVGAKKPTKRALALLDMLGICEVWEVSESSKYYPTKIVAGYERRIKKPEPKDGRRQ